MKNLIRLAFAFLVLTTAVPASAQDSYRYIGGSFLPMVQTAGFNGTVGHVYSFGQSASNAGQTVLVGLTAQKTPIVVDLRRKQTATAFGGYTPDFGLGFHVDFLRHTAPGSSPSGSVDRYSGSNKSSVSNGVFIFGDLVDDTPRIFSSSSSAPVENLPVQYNAGGSLAVTRASGYVTIAAQAAMGDNIINVRVFGGGSYLSLRNAEDKGEYFQTLIPGQLNGSTGINGIYQEDRYNTTSQSRFSGIGPGGGLEGGLCIKDRLTIRGQAIWSYVIGRTSHDGTFDWNERGVGAKVSGTSFQPVGADLYKVSAPSIKLDGGARANVPMSDFEVGVTYNTARLQIGAGWYFTRMWGASKAPTWEVPPAGPSAMYGSWQTRKTDLNLSGPKVTASFWF